MNLSNTSSREHEGHKRSRSALLKSLVSPTKTSQPVLGERNHNKLSTSRSRDTRREEAPALGKTLHNGPAREKENSTPPSTAMAGAPPIWAQFKTHQASSPSAKDPLVSSPIKTASSSISSKHVMPSSELDAAFEAVLARRNVPEKMRENMRSLDPIIKSDFIRHASSDDEQLEEPLPQKDSIWQTLRRGRAKSTTDKQKPDAGSSSPTKRDHSRSHSKKINTLEGSPTKRARSNSRPRSIFSLKNLSSSSVHKAGLDGSSESKDVPSSPRPGDMSDQLRRPNDFIDYLHDTPRPEDVEVGKLHKLRLLLRNESVSWVDTFILKDGMREMLGLLDRVRALTWREEHEDLVLHEVLLCLKGLCTTQRALDKLAEASSSLFPNLLNMLFDEERRGPSEFNTRGVVVNLLFMHLSNSPVEQLAHRAKTLLSFLADPQPPEEDKPIGFLLEMQERRYRVRPYQRWCKEFGNVTKEVFWIFMHHNNVIALPEETADGLEPKPYYKRHFPKTRPPEALNPWVGGVEWEATTYLAIHVDLINGLIAATPTRTERNELRQQLKDSGFERVLGVLRLCKEKFYPAPHEAVREWVAAAVEDNWEAKDVRMGVPRDDTASPSKSPSKENAAPKLELPNLDLGGL